ncbi:MAG TPA: hypothetical protein VGG20_15880 [Thermoanaerobaculia bacterium]|jgi:hypothetical protein
MGHSLHKDIKDITDTKIADHKRTYDVYTTKNFDIPDRFGPVKYDIPDQILRTYIDLLPVVAQRIDAIEEHLEKGAGKAFIRSQERPEVGGDAIHGLTEGLRKLNERLDRLEARGK